MGWFSDFWAKVVRAFIGKRIAILGKRGTGKTVLGRFLHEGVFTTEYVQTLGEGEMKARSFALNDLKLHIDAGKDLPGAEDQYRVWEKIFAECHFCFYLIRTDEVVVDNAANAERVEGDVDFLYDWRRKRPQAKIFLLLTHADKDQKYVSTTEATRGDYEDSVRRRRPVSYAIKKLSLPASHVIVGSLKSLESTEATVHRLFKAVLG